MAGAIGLEPTTPGFGDRCSTRLSYTPKVSSTLEYRDFFNKSIEEILKNGAQQGYGKMTWSDGQTYLGEWRNG